MNIISANTKVKLGSAIAAAIFVMSGIWWASHVTTDLGHVKADVSEIKEILKKRGYADSAGATDIVAYK